MRNTAHIANPSSTPKTGFFATLRAFLHTQGIGASLAVATATVALLALPASSAFASGDANNAACPFETEASPGFRSFLPDCRAYELVAPSYQNGDPVGWINKVPPPVSPDGEHILGLDVAGFAGSENVEEHDFTFGAIYEFSRTSSGWSTESLEPSASQYARSSFVEASADLGRSLWELSIQPAGEELAIAGGEALDIRERVGGEVRFSEVGPNVPPGVSPSLPPRLGVVGASRDLTQLALSGLASESERLWPGDTTHEGGESLYEYVGTGNREPALVGVSNAGPLQGTTYLNEDARLISECGTILGSTGTASAYNAISSDGAKIYFTALHGNCTTPEVNEVYARVDGAKTVAISEPSKENCEDCVESSKTNAVFQGASEDGSKVFFTTEQELLRGQTGENLYEYDFDAEEGHRIMLASPGASTPEVQSVARISEDGSHIYFVAKGVLTTTPNGNGEKAEAGAYNVYVYDTETGTPAFVADLLTQPEAEGLSIEEISERTHASVLDQRRPFETTPDGRFLVFLSDRDLTGSEDTSTVDQVFLYDTRTGAVARASLGQCPAATRGCAPGARFNGNGNTTNSEDAASILAPGYAYGMKATEATSALSLSESGAVVFRSPEALTPLAVAGRENVYGYRPENIYEYREGNVSLISPVDETAPLHVGEGVRMLGTDESGDDVFFYTADSLVPQDTDSQASWYDARIGGGFPAPVSPAGCEGEACQGPLSAMPFLPAAGGSAAQATGENLPPPIPKPAVKPKSTPLTRAQKLAKALKACHKLRSRTSRAACEKKAKSIDGTKVRNEKIGRRGHS